MTKLPFFLIALAYGAIAHAEPWTPDFESRSGIKEFLLALEHEEPGLIERSARFGTNVVEVAQTVPELLRVLGADATSMRIEENYTEFPAAFAMFRSVYSRETPLDGSAYYSLVKGTHTFVFERQGAAFVVEVEHEGRTIPYVVTVEGPGMTEAATQRALHFIASYFNSDLVVLPESSRGYSFTDSELARRVLSEIEAVEVELAGMPKGWAKLDAWLAARGYTGSFFREESLRRARLALVPEEFKQAREIESRPDRDFPSTLGRSREIVASQAVWRGWSVSEASTVFGVSPENLIPVSNVCRRTAEAADEGS